MSTLDGAGDRPRIPYCMCYDLSRIVESSTQGFVLQGDHMHDQIIHDCVNVSKNVDRDVNQMLAIHQSGVLKCFNWGEESGFQPLSGIFALGKYTWASLQDNHLHLQRYTRSVYHIASQFAQIPILGCEQYASPTNRARPIPCRCLHRYRAE